jgi:hypothetical protein
MTIVKSNLKKNILIIFFSLIEMSKILKNWPKFFFTFYQKKSSFGFFGQKISVTLLTPCLDPPKNPYIRGDTGRGGWGEVSIGGSANQYYFRTGGGFTGLFFGGANQHCPMLSVVGLVVHIPT